MKHLISSLLLLLTIFSFGQSFPFAKDFKTATITLNDGTKKNGFIKWNTNQNERLRFKEAENSEVIKYSAAEIADLSVDTFRYKSLFNVELYACILISRFGNQPINDSIMTWNSNSLPANWTILRDKWWSFHIMRTITELISLCLIVWASINKENITDTNNTVLPKAGLT